MDDDFEATSVGDATEWRFNDNRLNRLVELVTEHGDDIYELDPDEVRSRVFDGTEVAVDDADPLLDLNHEGVRFVNDFVSQTPVSRTGSVDELFEDGGAFEEIVHDRLSDSDPEKIKEAVEWKAAKQ